jgi:hypothetical protein
LEGIDFFSLRDEDEWTVADILFAGTQRHCRLRALYFSPHRCESLIGRRNFVVPCHKFPPDDEFDDFIGTLSRLFCTMHLLIINMISRGDVRSIVEHLHARLVQHAVIAIPWRHHDIIYCIKCVSVILRIMSIDLVFRPLQRNPKFVLTESWHGPIPLPRFGEPRQRPHR